MPPNLDFFEHSFSSQKLSNWLNDSFPVSSSPLVHCITNDVTSETVANALLYTGAKPIMAHESAEVEAIVENSDALLLNLGQLTLTKKDSIVSAAKAAGRLKKPFVIDMVGIGASKLRLKLAHDLIGYKPVVIKGNLSEIKVLCNLETLSKGVDAASADSTEESLTEVERELQRLAKDTGITFLATGQTDLAVSPDHVVRLFNGTDRLDQFAGTGDIAGALTTALSAVRLPPLEACISAVSYLNLCGEAASKEADGLESFRLHTLNHLSKLYKQKQWYLSIKGEFHEY